MEDRNLLTNDKVILDRINDLQKEIDFFNVNLLEVHRFGDGSMTYHFSIIINQFRSWTTYFIKKTPEEQKDCNSFLQMIEYQSEQIISVKNIQSFKSSKPHIEVNKENLKLLKEILFNFECYLKNMTDKYYSNSKIKEKLFR